MGKERFATLSLMAWTYWAFACILFRRCFDMLGLNFAPNYPLIGLFADQVPALRLLEPIIANLSTIGLQLIDQTIKLRYWSSVETTLTKKIGHIFGTHSICFSYRHDFHHD